MPLHNMLNLNYSIEYPTISLSIITLDLIIIIITGPTQVQKMQRRE